MERMRSESDRLSTFLYGKWPVSFISPKDLAKAGFFYLQKFDQVQCAFCAGKLEHWEHGEFPLMKHGRCFPKCPFIRGYYVENEPIGQDPARKPELGSPALALNEFGVFQYQKPMHEQFVLLNSRKLSFSSAKLSKYNGDQLSEAGFFFSRGCILCAFCGVRAFIDDFALNPWEEHALLSPQCYFVVTCKGPQFVASCQNRAFSKGSGKARESDDGFLISQIGRLGIANNFSATQRYTCKICLKSEVEIVFLPCSHTVACGSCAVGLAKCPSCSKDVTAVTRLVFS